MAVIARGRFSINYHLSWYLPYIREVDVVVNKYCRGRLVWFEVSPQAFLRLKIIRTLIPEKPLDKTRYLQYFKPSKASHWLSVESYLVLFRTIDFYSFMSFSEANWLESWWLLALGECDLYSSNRFQFIPYSYGLQFCTNPVCHRPNTSSLAIRSQRFLVVDPEGVVSSIRSRVLLPWSGIIQS